MELGKQAHCSACDEDIRVLDMGYDGYRLVCDCYDGEAWITDAVRNSVDGIKTRDW